MAYCYRVILVGEYGVGKTCLFRRFRDALFLGDQSPASTIGCDTTSKMFKVGTNRIQLELWDTGGMERVSSMNLSYFRGAHAAVICYCPLERISFDLISDYMIQVEQLANPNCRMFICATKSDLVEQRPLGADVDTRSSSNVVTSSEIKDFEMECTGMLAGSFKTSSKTNSGVDEMFRFIGKKLYESRPSIVFDSIKLHDDTTLTHNIEFNEFNVQILPYKNGGHYVRNEYDDEASDIEGSLDTEPGKTGCYRQNSRSRSQRHRLPNIHTKHKSNCCR